MIANEWDQLRVAAVDAGGKRSHLDSPNACDILAVARDGVWRFQVPKLLQESTFSVTGESCLDVAIKCPSCSFLWTAIVYAHFAVGADSNAFLRIYSWIFTARFRTSPAWAR